MNMILKRDGKAASQAGFVGTSELKKPWVDGFMVHNRRTIPVVSTKRTWADRWGTIKARWGVGRMRYVVLPGLYAVGTPTSDSSVFVTANYKLSFDALRLGLDGLDGWILVLDTKGINVWCAAGKGTFGTNGLVSALASVKLGDIVTHRNLILPQLGASGVSAPEVAKSSAFRVEWGPVRAADIPAWLAAGKKKDAAMRKVSFNLGDRMATAPVELVHSWPILLAALVLGSIFGLPVGKGLPARAVPAVLILVGTIPVGTVLFPAILPWLPSRAFVVKGAFLGVVWAATGAAIFRLTLLATLGAVLIAAPVVGFLAMNFTGASTYTCQGGALLEVEKSFWPMVISMIAGLAAASASRFFGL